MLLSLLLILQLTYPFVTIVLAQFFGKERLGTSSALQQNFDYACIITAYRNADIAQPLVDSLLQQSHSKFIIYLVADECPETAFSYSDDRFVYLRPELPLRLKAKSIIHAVAHFKRAHDYIVVFDADNLAHPQYLETINQYANAGHRCIQGQRRAKNLDSSYAALDSMGEHYKNYIERRVPYLLGGSAVISGSGMATAADLYRGYLASPEIEQGQHQWKKMLQEDKILQNFILQGGGKIAYAHHALVYDEKVDSGQAVETQRSRWLFSYFQNLPNAGGLLLRGIFKLNFNQAYFGFVTLALPMFLQVGLAVLLSLIGLWVAPFWSLALALALCLFTLGILWALKLDEAPKPVWDALWQVPKFVLRQMLGLLKMRNPDKHFKHTEQKKKVTVEEAMGKGFSEK